MPAGSGPQCTTVTSGSITASEIAVATSAPASWNNPRADQGNLISASVSYTASAAGTYPIAAQIQETTAFGLSQQGGQYTLTLQSSIAGPGTVVYALLELETAAPVI